MADTRIICTICTVISRPRSLVVNVSDSEPEDQDRFTGGHLLYLVFFFFCFSVIMLKYFIQVICDI